MDMRIKPIAVCTRCGSYSYNANAINQRCGQKAGKIPCGGVYGGALRTEDWVHCQQCSGTGFFNSKRCDLCQASGWWFVRGQAR